MSTDLGPPLVMCHAETFAHDWLWNLACQGHVYTDPATVMHEVEDFPNLIFTPSASVFTGGRETTKVKIGRCAIPKPPPSTTGLHEWGTTARITRRPNADEFTS